MSDCKGTVMFRGFRWWWQQVRLGPASGHTGGRTSQHQPGLTVSSLGEIQSLGSVLLQHQGSWYGAGTGWLSTWERNLLQLGAGLCHPSLFLCQQEEEAQLCLSSGPLLSYPSSGEQTPRAARFQFGCTTDKL